MELTPVLAHGGDLLVLPMLIAAVVAITVALKDGKRRQPTATLPTTSLGRQVRAAMRPPAKPRPEATTPRTAVRQARPALQILRQEHPKDPVPRRWAS